MMTQVLDEDEKFPMEIQENIVKFVKETLFPAILDHVASIYPPLFGLPITVLSFECFFYHYGTFEDAFTRKEWIDLFKLKIIKCLPSTEYLCIHGNALIGAIVRISNSIGKQEFEDILKTMVPDYIYKKYCDQ